MLLQALYIQTEAVTKIYGAPLLCHIKLCAIFHCHVNSNWGYDQETAKLGFDLDQLLIGNVSWINIILLRIRQLAGQGAIPLRGMPGWLIVNPVWGTRESPVRMQLHKLQVRNVIYGNPEHTNWYQSFPTHVWLQCGMLADLIKTMQAKRNAKIWNNINIF